jgi:hypothetical protein
MTQTQQILEAALHAFNTTTGLKAHADVYEPLGDRRADALLQVETRKRKYTFLAEVKAVDRFATPALIKAREAEGARPAILVAPYITRETAEHCRQLKLPFIDTAGNAYIEAEGLLVYVVGQHRPIDLVREKFRALTPAGLQLTFALLCRPDLLHGTYRGMMRAAKVALGTIGPAIKDMQNRGLLQFAPNGKPRISDYGRLLEEWVTRYPTTLRPKLEARRFEADPQMLANADLKQQHAFWGGEPAADRLTHMLRPKEFTIYTPGPWMPLAAAYRMRAHHRGNVEILRAFWDFILDGVDLDLAPPLLVYADLMATQDGRNLEIAKRIYEQYIEPKVQRTR